MGEGAASADTATPGDGSAEEGNPADSGSSGAVVSTEDMEPAAERTTAKPGDPASIAELCEAVAELGKQAARDHLRAEAREKTIDRLHGELERLRAGESRLLLRPIVADLRRLHHELVAEARSIDADLSPVRAAEMLTFFAESVELALERCGVTVIQPAPGSPCEPGLHQVAEFELTNDVRLAGRIARVASEGYLDIGSGRPFSPARVIVYRSVQADTEGAPSSSGTNRAEPRAGAR